MKTDLGDAPNIVAYFGYGQKNIFITPLHGLCYKHNL